MSLDLHRTRYSITYMGASNLIDKEVFIFSRSCVLYVRAKTTPINYWYSFFLLNTMLAVIYSPDIFRCA